MLFPRSLKFWNISPSRLVLPDLSPFSVLVAGAGSIGRRHLRNLRQLGVQELAVCDPDAERCAAIVNELGVEAFGDLGAGLEARKPDAALNVTPPVLHVSQARLPFCCGARP